jgi:ribose transport system substrate-binding protein
VVDPRATVTMMPTDEMNEVLNEPFDPERPAGATPPVPRRMVLSLPLMSPIHVLFADGMRDAAEQHNVEFVLSDGKHSEAKQIADVTRLLDEGIGGLEIDAFDIESVRALKQRAIDAGVGVFGSAAGPTVTRVQTDFYLVGRMLGEAAAEWITTRLGGRATVVHYPHGQFGPVARDRGVEDAIAALGADVTYLEIEPPKELESKEGGFRFTTQVLEQHRDANVWLGPDRMMVGSFEALQAAGRADEGAFVGGFDGMEEALERIAQGTPYRASVGLPHPLVGYATGQFLAAWLDGGNVPQILYGKPRLLTSAAEIEAFTRAYAPSELARAFVSSAEHLTLAGNISYETRDRYVAEDF